VIYPIGNWYVSSTLFYHQVYNICTGRRQCQLDGLQTFSARPVGHQRRRYSTIGLLTPPFASLPTKDHSITILQISLHEAFRAKPQIPSHSCPEVHVQPWLNSSYNKYPKPTANTAKAPCAKKSTETAEPAPGVAAGKLELELPDFVVVEFLLGADLLAEDPVVTVVAVSVATTTGAVVVLVEVLVEVIVLEEPELDPVTTTTVLEVLETAVAEADGVVDGVVLAAAEGVVVALVVMLPGEPGQLG